MKSKKFLVAIQFLGLSLSQLSFGQGKLASNEFEGQVGQFDIVAPIVSDRTNITDTVETGTIVYDINGGAFYGRASNDSTPWLRLGDSETTNPAVMVNRNGSNQTFSQGSSSAVIIAFTNNSSGIAFEQNNGTPNFNTSTYRFTVPAGGAGVYNVNAQMTFTGANIVAGGQYYIRIYKNGSSVLVGNQIPYANGKDITPKVNGILNLVAGDYLEVYASSDQNHSSSTITIYGGGEATYFNVNKQP